MALVMVAIAALAAVVLTAPHPPSPTTGGLKFEGATLPKGVRAPEIGLLDQDGQKVSMSALRGEPVVVTFLYTHCQDTCPVEAQQVKGALDLLGHDVPAIAIAVVPPNDTAASARQFLNENRMTGRMDFALGTQAQLEPLWKAFAVRPQTRQEEHQARVVLVDSKGFQRIGFPVAEVTPERLAHDLRLLEAEELGHPNRY
jgi:protein SCO1/2